MLAVIAMISGGILAVVYDTTSVIIEENQARALESSIYDVLPGTTTVNILRRSPDELGVDDPREMREQEQRTTLIYQGVDDQGRVVGYAFMGEANGYGGVIRVLVGVDQATIRFWLSRYWIIRKRQVWVLESKKRASVKGSWARLWRIPLPLIKTLTTFQGHPCRPGLSPRLSAEVLLIHLHSIGEGSKHAPLERLCQRSME